MNNFFSRIINQAKVTIPLPAWEGCPKGRIGTVVLSCLMGLASCTQDSPVSDMTAAMLKPQEKPVVIDHTAFPQGADVSWLTQMEAQGMKFYNADNKEMECMTLLRDECGVNSIRLRVWVNPADGWCNISDVVIKARRAQKLGLRTLIDFHFSDTWADPGSQKIPAAWAALTTADQVKEALVKHVTECLNKLKVAGVSPDWVQIGNETRNGMMYMDADGNELPTAINGRYNNGTNFTNYVNAGYDAVKAVFPEAKVVVHIDSGQTASLYSRIFGKLQEQGGKYDIIGISLYPDVSDWRTYVDNTVSNISQAYNNWGKDVMVVEFGMPVNSKQECKDALQRLLTNGKATGHLAGVFYWEPQAPEGYNGGYSKGCFINGTPTIALDPFIGK